MPAVYENGSGAARSLRKAGIIVDDRRTFPGEACHHQFLHALMICEGLASLDLGVRATPHLRFIAWPEILGRAPEATRASRTPFRVPVPSGSYLVLVACLGSNMGAAKRPTASLPLKRIAARYRSNGRMAVRPHTSGKWPDTVKS